MESIDGRETRRKTRWTYQYFWMFDTKPPPCHSERSEESPSPREILRCAQNDRRGELSTNDHLIRRGGGWVDDGRGRLRRPPSLPVPFARRRPDRHGILSQRAIYRCEVKSRAAFLEDLTRFLQVSYCLLAITIV
jgi:hypothetical protein